MSKEDKPDAWMPLYIGDWDGDTAHLTCEEDGAYGRLVRTYWRKGPPKNDDAQLARIVRMELKAWKRVRPALEGFFQIADGLWRHKRVDAELIRWAAKKVAAVEKAKIAAEKRWGKRDAPSNATSTAQARPKQSPSSSAFQEEGPNGPSSLKPQIEFLGPKEVWDDFLTALGPEWCASWLAPCTWQDVPERALIPANRFAGEKLVRDGKRILAKHGLTVLERSVA